MTYHDKATMFMINNMVMRRRRGETIHAASPLRGNSSFDDVLKQALALQLEQSPYLNILSGDRVAAIGRMMNRGESD